MEQKKYVKCVNNLRVEDELTLGATYEVASEHLYQYILCTNNNHRTEVGYFKYRFEDVPAQQEEFKEVAIDAHYNFDFKFKLTDDVEMKLKVDPYFVAKQWRLGLKDDSGVLFHILKTIARFGDKNSKEREITAMYKSIKRLAELEGVFLEN